MLKCFPSKTAHCSSRKSFFCLEHGSVLQDLNFILRPTQYFPPFLGLKNEILKNIYLQNDITENPEYIFILIPPAFETMTTPFRISFYFNLSAAA